MTWWRVLIVSAVLVTSVFAQKDPHWKSGRNTIVHLFEWKFSDIADECERFLGPYGYAGVQTSPVNECAAMPSRGRPWWERYQPISYEIISRSGNETEFADMVSRCNNAGVRVYVDVILNHMSGNIENATGYGGNTADTENRIYYAVPYGPEHFNTPCEMRDYNNVFQVRDCLLTGLYDLNQTHPHVREKLIEFLDKLADYGVAGFRVDAAKHMWPTDLSYIYSFVQNLNTSHDFASNSKPFYYQEVIDMADSESVRNYEYMRIGAVTEFRYGHELSNCFRGNNAIKWLVNWGPEWNLLASNDALVFIDNHDTQRSNGGHGTILTHKTPKLYKMAIGFMLSWPYGITRIMSSFYFTDTDEGPPADDDGNILDVIVQDDGTCGNGWVCEHRWRQIYNMVRFKNWVVDTQVSNWWDNGSKQIAFCRGSSGFIVFNNEYNVDLKQTLQTCLEAGVYCDIISGLKEGNNCTGKSVRIENDGTAYVEILASDEDGFLAITGESKL